MPDQQTDVLDFGSPAVVPSIVEGTAAPQSPATIDYDLFDDDAVPAEPIAVTEPETTAEGPSEVEDVLPVLPAPESAAAESVPTETVATVADVPPVDDEVAAVSTVEEGSAEPTAVEADATPVVTEPEAATSGEPRETEAAAPAEDQPESGEAPAAPAPEEPVLSFSLDDLERALDDKSEKKLAEPAGVPVTETVEAEAASESRDADEEQDDASAPTVDTEASDQPDTEGESASVESVPVQTPSVVTPVAPAEPVVMVAEPARPTVATYEDIQNTAQQFEGAIKVKKFPLIDPDQYWVMIVALVALSGILAANLTSSFTSVYAMARYIGLPREVQWLPVVTLDVAIVGFSWALMVFGARGDKVWTTRLYLFVVTGFSVVANFLHTYTYWHGHLTTPEHIFGVVFSSAVPVFSLVATEELIRLVFIRRVRRTKKAVK